MKSLSLNFFTVAIFALLVFFLSAQSTFAVTKVLTDSSIYTIKKGISTLVYGTSGVNIIVLESGAEAKLRNFIGSNAIIVQANSTIFKVSRSGASVTIEGTDGTKLTMPATTALQTIEFNDLAYELVINAGSVYFGTQIVTSTPTSVEAALSSCDNSNLDLCTTNSDCSGASGYWWADNTCRYTPVSNGSVGG